jgi:hypothetical protein
VSKDRLITLKLYTQVKDDEIDMAGVAMTEYLKKNIDNS